MNLPKVTEEQRVTRKWKTIKWIPEFVWIHFKEFHPDERVGFSLIAGGSYNDHVCEICEKKWGDIIKGILENEKKTTEENISTVNLSAGEIQKLKKLN